MTTRRKKVGFINVQRPDMKVKKKWKSYRFEINASYFFYCKTDNTRNPDGMILLGSITKLETNAVKDATFPLQVHFKGKPVTGSASSPWVLDLTSNEERMDWMECLIPGSSKELQMFSRPGSMRRVISPDHTYQSSTYHEAREYDSPSSLTSNGSYHGLHTPTSPQAYMDFVPQVKAGQFSKVDSDSESSYVSGNPTRPVGCASTESHDSLKSFTGSRPRSQNVNADNFQGQQKNSPGLQPPLVSASPISSLPASFPGRQDPQRHSLGHGGRSKETNENVPSVLGERPRSSTASGGVLPKAQPRIQQRDLPHRPWGETEVHSKDELDTTGSPVHHLYEMDDTSMNEYLSSLDDVLPKSPPVKLKPTPPSRKSHQSSSRRSCEKEGEFDSPEGKEGEYDTPHTPPVPAPRPSRNSAKPAVVPRRKKEPVVEQHEYLDLMPDHKRQEERRDNYLKELSDLGLNLQVVQNFSAEQLSKLRVMLQEGHEAVAATPFPGVSDVPGNGNAGQNRLPVNYVDSLPTDKILVTDEDSEDSYLRRPEWAKAIGLDASRQRPQLSSHCEALSDLQEEALYIPRSSVNNFHEIGEGQFGKVFRATMHRGKGKSFSVAVKTAKKSTSDKEKAEFLREMNIMSQMRHPNIVQLHGIIRDDVPAPWIVLEFLRHGDLKNFLIKNPRPVERLVTYMTDVAMGMHYLSEKGLVHRDLAARNVLISEDETCKVSDFGLLRELPKDDSIYHMNTTVPCPVRWMAPESIENRNFSPASDVWSFGILQWEMFNPKSIPYKEFGNMDVVLKVMRGYRLEVPPDCPSVVSRIMKACWHHVPEKRPSFLLITTLLAKVEC